MEFQTTMWTSIGRAKAGSKESLERLLSRYQAPILAYLRGRGLSEHDAEDVSQEVLVQLSRETFLERADKAKGRFRTLVLRVTRNVFASHARWISSLKRGGGRPALSLDDVFEEPAPETDEARFHELWARNLLQIALDRLGRDAARLKVPYRDVLVMRHFEGKQNPEIAEKLGCKPHDVENYLYLGKQRLRKYLMDLAREYSSSPEEYADEVEFLKKSLG